MTGRLAWYRRYPGSWRGGTNGMPWDLQGVYSAVIDEIVLQEGAAAIDLRAFARLGKSNARAVKRLLAELERRGKLSRDADGRYHNGRANHDVEAALRALDRGKLSGKLGGKLNDRSKQVSAKQLAKHEDEVSPEHDEGLPESLAQTFEETAVKSTDEQAHAHVSAHEARAPAPREPLERKAGERPQKPSAAGPDAPVEVGSLRPMASVEVEPPADPALVGRLVSAGLKRRSNANGAAKPHADERGDRDHQEALPEPQRTPAAEPPATGLFGVVARATRKGHEEDQ